MARGVVLIFLVFSANPAFAQSTLPIAGAVANAVKLDSAGNIYIAGYYVANPQEANAPARAIVAKLSPNGSQVLWQTALGGSGSDVANALALDSSNSVYVAGTAQSADFPTTPDSLQPAGAGNQAFAVKLDSSGHVVYSAYLPGTLSGEAIAVDSGGHAFITG